MPATVLVAKGSVWLSEIAWPFSAGGILPTRRRDKKKKLEGRYSSAFCPCNFKKPFLMLWREALRGSRPISSG